MALCVAAFFATRHVGEGLTAAGTAAPSASGKGAHGGDLAQVLVALALITVIARVTGRAVEKWLRQPPVMGEIVAGILLGPSALGALSPSLQAFVLPPAATPHLSIIARVGVVLFMFLVGLELDPSLLRGNARATLAIASTSMMVPFTLGAASALVLYPLYANSSVSFTVFALFLGTSMAVTAFPVLARILTDRKMQSTPLGATAIACAAVGDAFAWCLLSFVSGVARASLGDTYKTLGLVVLHAAVIVVVVRPLVRHLAEREEKRKGEVSRAVLAFVLGLMLLSAAFTETIGIHALFGAFLFGAVIPHDGRLAHQIRIRTEDLVVVLLLPIFFAITGMRTRVGLLSSPRDLASLALVIAVASAGKLGGTFGAARGAGMGARDAGALAILMNTRGLMELIVLNVGLEMGVISETVFAMLVLMALVTTFTTAPLLELVMGRRRGASPGEGATGQPPASAR